MCLKTGVKLIWWCSNLLCKRLCRPASIDSIVTSVMCTRVKVSLIRIQFSVTHLSRNNSLIFGKRLFKSISKLRLDRAQQLLGLRIFLKHKCSIKYHKISRTGKIQRNLINTILKLFYSLMNDKANQTSREEKASFWLRNLSIGELVFWLKLVFSRWIFCSSNKIWPCRKNGTRLKNNNRLDLEKEPKAAKYKRKITRLLLRMSKD